MKENAGEKRLSLSFQSARSKVIAGFVLAGAALVLFWLGNRMVFGAALRNMEELSRPNDKLMQVHQLFEEFTRTDQLQRRIAVEERRGRREQINALSDSLLARVEGLKELYQDEAGQLSRLDSIKLVMDKRNRLFREFMQERDRLMSNSVLAGQARELSDWLSDIEPVVDSSSQTQTFRQATTTTIQPDTLIRVIEIGRQGGFFNRLFGKKKPSGIENTYVESEAQVKVEERVDSMVTNLSVVQRDTLRPYLEERLRGMVQGQQQQISRMAWSELAFLRAGYALTNEIRFLLYEIEEEEMRRIDADQAALAKLISGSFSVFNWLLVGILLILATLIFLILTDFSKSRRYRAQLVQARNEAERLSRVKERFLSNMSHEIRTPLQSIIGYAEQIQKTERPDDSDKAAIYQSARHLLQIVNEILDYNRLVSGHFQMDARPFDPAILVEEVSAVVKVQAEKKGLKYIAGSGAAPPGLLLGDAFRFRQILFNLLGNAIKFTHEGEVRLRADVEQTGDAYLLKFRVEDTGIGMAKEDLEHVFNQFEQAPGLDRERYGGTGLGLSIVKALVDIQGGTIEVESEVGRGTRFLVSIPCALVAVPVSGSERTSPPAINLLASQPGALHVVDDDVYTMRLCLNVLRDARYRASGYASSMELLEGAALEAGDAVLTDIRLPGISGYQLLERLRRVAPDVKVIAMTAQALPAEREAMRKAGFDGVLVKPFTADELTGMAARFTSPEAAAQQAEQTGEADELMELFAEENQKDMEALQAALKDNDAPAAAETLHRLAGRCGQFGFMDSYRELRRLELQLRGGTGLADLREEIETMRYPLTT